MTSQVSNILNDQRSRMNGQTLSQNRQTKNKVFCTLRFTYSPKKVNGAFADGVKYKLRVKLCREVHKSVKKLNETRKIY